MCAETKMNIAKTFRQFIAASIFVGATGLAYPANAGPTYEYFDVGLPKESALYAYSINASGVIVGEVLAAGRNKFHGFMRNTDGTIVLLGGVRPFDVNDAGQIVGERAQYGFLRQPDGKMVKIAVPGAATSVEAINAKGDSVGAFIIAGAYHGFLRTADGKITTIDPAEDSTDQEAIDINSKGQIIGGYYDTMWHGFIRDPQGNVTFLDLPDGAKGTYLMRLNNKGDVTGIYVDSDSLRHAFVRSADGVLAEFDGPGASETVATGINNKGAVTGYYLDSGGQHGFVRAPDGTITTIDVPVKNSGTSPYSINDSGEITGNYSTVVHRRVRTLGFLRHP